MIKIAAVVHRAAGLTPEAFDELYAAAPETPSPGVCGHTRHRIRASGGTPPPCDGLSFLWLEDPALAPHVVLEPTSAIGRCNRYRVDEVVHWDRLGARCDGAPTPGVKMVAFVRRRADLSPDEFRARYLAHAEVARKHHPGIGRYVQNFVRGLEPPGAPVVDAIAELHFPSEQDRRDRFYRDEASPAVVAADVARFLLRDGTWSLLATEHVVRLPPAA